MKNNSGFSFIELLVVMLIMGLLYYFMLGPKNSATGSKADTYKAAIDEAQKKVDQLNKQTARTREIVDDIK